MQCNFYLSFGMLTAERSGLDMSKFIEPSKALKAKVSNGIKTWYGYTIK